MALAAALFALLAGDVLLGLLGSLALTTALLAPLLRLLLVGLVGRLPLAATLLAARLDGLLLGFLGRLELALALFLNSCLLRILGSLLFTTALFLSRLRFAAWRRLPLALLLLLGCPSLRVSRFLALAAALLTRLFGRALLGFARSLTLAPGSILGGGLVGSLLLAAALLFGRLRLNAPRGFDVALLLLFSCAALGLARLLALATTLLAGLVGGALLGLPPRRTLPLGGFLGCGLSCCVLGGPLLKDGLLLSSSLRSCLLFTLALRLGLGRSGLRCCLGSLLLPDRLLLRCRFRGRLLLALTLSLGFSRSGLLSSLSGSLLGGLLLPDCIVLGRSLVGRLPLGFPSFLPGAAALLAGVFLCRLRLGEPETEWLPTGTVHSDAVDLGERAA